MSDVLNRVAQRAEFLRDLRDNHGWPEPRNVHDLRRDPRVQLRNHPDAPGGEKENLELAAALILLVAEETAV